MPVSLTLKTIHSLIPIIAFRLQSDRAFFSEFAGVAEQVKQDLPHFGQIGMNDALYWDGQSPDCYRSCQSVVDRCRHFAIMRDVDVLHTDPSCPLRSWRSRGCR